MQRLLAATPAKIVTGDPVNFIQRINGRVAVGTTSGEAQWFDHVVIATHADQARTLLSDPSPAESGLLGAFSYTTNTAVLHSDTGLIAAPPGGLGGLELISRRDAGPSVGSASPIG